MLVRGSPFICYEEDSSIPGCGTRVTYNHRNRIITVRSETNILGKRDFFPSLQLLFPNYPFLMLESHIGVIRHIFDRYPGWHRHANRHFGLVFV